MKRTCYEVELKIREIKVLMASEVPSGLQFCALEGCLSMLRWLEGGKDPIFDLFEGNLDAARSRIQHVTISTPDMREYAAALRKGKKQF